MKFEGTLQKEGLPTLPANEQSRSTKKAKNRVLEHDETMGDRVSFMDILLNQSKGKRTILSRILRWERRMFPL